MLLIDRKASERRNVGAADLFIRPTIIYLHFQFRINNIAQFHSFYSFHSRGVLFTY
jgi:hypothetical protein